LSHSEGKVFRFTGIPEWKRERILEGFRRKYNLQRSSLKLMISIQCNIADGLTELADQRGISLQEQIRVILGDWNAERVRQIGKEKQK